MKKSIFLSAFMIILSSYLCAQVNEKSPLFTEIKKQDSIFFEKGFNQCDLDYLNTHITENLRFFHDQSGFQDKKSFFENTKKYICSDTIKKPVRKVDIKSLQVYPLYNYGILYGAIQTGTHSFFIREKGKKDVQTSAANFTHVWVLENNIWKLSDVLSYDHHSPEKPDSSLNDIK